jgi:hypothetical protein
VMVHKERLVALDKGSDPPAWPSDTSKSYLGVDTLLLLSGLIWLAIGLGGMLATFAILSQDQMQRIPDVAPPEVSLIGVPVALVGVAHLIVYGVRRRGQR